jgi:hypothetical protein
VVVAMPIQSRHQSAALGSGPGSGVAVVCHGRFPDRRKKTRRFAIEPDKWGPNDVRTVQRLDFSTSRGKDFVCQLLTPETSCRGYPP